jgi:hypothetical protein
MIDINLEGDNEMALFQSKPQSLSKVRHAAMLLRQADAERAAEALKLLRARLAQADALITASDAALAEHKATTDASFAQDLDAGRPLESLLDAPADPGLEKLLGRKRRAEAARDHLAELVSGGETAHQVTQDRQREASEAHERAVKMERHERALAHLDRAQAEFAGFAIDYGIGRVAAQIDAELQRLAALEVEPEVQLAREQANGYGTRTWRVSLDAAIREVAAGNASFADDFDARRFASHVAAAAKEITKAEAARKRARV